MELAREQKTIRQFEKQWFISKLYFGKTIAILKWYFEIIFLLFWNYIFVFFHFKKKIWNWKLLKMLLF